MAAGSWVIYNDGKERIINGDIDLNGDTLKCKLLTSSYSPAVTHSTISDLTNECADGDYSAQTVGGAAVTETSGTVTFDCTDITFGSNVTITAKYAAMYSDTHASDALICYVDLDTGGGSVSSTSGTFTIVINNSGVFTVA
tara:strand:- start:75 stop:497 length:423 start_codon:yes stop_codon:yes gene_type:complete